MPVNYLMHGETVVFRTDPNSKLGRAVRSTVCLRIRQHHQITGSGKLIKK